MPLTDDLYRDIILEHFKSPRNYGRLEKPSVTSHGANPFCGDELELTLALEGNGIRDLRVQPRGCSISQASASMMSEAVKGKSLPEAERLARQFKAVMLEGAAWESSPETEDLEALEGVKKYPVRIKCALLSWNTLLEGLAASRKGQSEATHVESGDGEPAEPAPELPSLSGAPRDPAGQPAGEQSPEEQAREALKAVIDPELNLNVVDLGLVYGIGIQDGQVTVTYTLTSPGCPLGPVIQGQIKSVLTRLGWVKAVQTQLVWTPPWDPRTMASEEIKTELGIW